MYCGNCYTMCPALPCFDSEKGGVALLVGGKVSNAKTPPMFSRLAVPYIPNNPPRWPETVATIRKILIKYAEGANKWERVGEWIERIGWEKFFESLRHSIHLSSILTTISSRRMILIERPCILNSKQVTEHGIIQRKNL